MQKSSEHFGKTRDRQGSFIERFSLREIKKEKREEIMKPKNMLLTLDTCLEQEKTGEKNRAAGDGTDEWTDACSVPTLYGLDPAGKYSKAFC